MKRSFSLLSLAALSALATQAAAYVQPSHAAGPTPGELQVKEGDPVRGYAPNVGAVPAARASDWSKFLQAAGGQWIGMWDEHTGVPMAVHGSGIPAPGTVNDAAEAERFTRAFVARYIAILAPGASASDLQLDINYSDGEMRTVGFAQTYRGMKVIEARLIFEFKNDRLFVFGSTAFPNIKLPEAQIGTTASLESLKTNAVGWMADVGKTLVASKTSEPKILPLVRASGAIDYHRVTEVEVTEPNGFGSWTVYVDTATGAQVARKDNLMYADGVLNFKVPQRAPLFGPRVDRPAALANISVGGTAAKTDNYGKMTWTAAGDATVTTNCTGTLVTVNSTSSAKATGSVTVVSGGSGVWDMGTDEKADAQLTCFTSINVVKEHVARFIPRGQIAWLNNALTVNANQNNTCNANWNGSAGTVQFFNAGDHATDATRHCENTGRLTDVVYHEFGHGLHQNVVSSGGGSTNNSGADGLGEGVGDTLSISITQDPNMSPGFFVDRPMTGIRNADAIDQPWPTGQTEVHASGLTYAGWMFDLRKNFKKAYGDREGNWLTDRLFYESVRRATSTPTTVTQAIAADDDDGNTANGTPNLCIIYEAAKRHTLFGTGTGTPQNPAAAALIPGVAPPTVDGSKVTVKLIGTEFCPAAIDPQSVVAAYQPRGGTTPTNVTLAKDASGNYVGDLPNPGTAVGTFKVTSTFPNGKVYTFPQNAADPNYEFYAGPITKLYCTDFEGTTAPADWTHTGTPATADEWEWGSPGEVALTNDPRVAFSGTKAFGMDLGKWTTDGLYPASGTSSLQSPIINTAGMGQVHLQYRRQLNVETGASDQANIYANGTKVWNNSTTANHVDKEWRFHDVDLTAQAASGTVQVKFELVANGTTHFGGWNIDDFCIVSTQGDGGTQPPVTDGGDGGGIVDVSVDMPDGAAGSAGSAGAGGSAGTAGSAGAAGKGGAAGSAGSGGTAGKAGSAGNGGASGSSGAAGSAGAAAGAAGAAGSGGAAGASGTGGTGGTGGSGATGGASSGAGGSTEADDGCSCRIGAPSNRSNSFAWLAALPLVGLALRRRRR